MKNKKKEIIILTIIIILLLIFSSILIFVLTRGKLYKNIIQAQQKAMDSNSAPFICEIYDNKDSLMKALIRLNYSDGIEYVECPNGNKIYCYGKENLGFDYYFSIGQTYLFKIKTETGDVKEETIVANEDLLPINIIKEIKEDNYQVVTIKNKLSLPNFKISYKYGNNED